MCWSRSDQGKSEHFQHCSPPPLRTFIRVIVLRPESRLRTLWKLFKISTPAFTPSSLACQTCSGACNRNTMSNAGQNSQTKLSMSSPAPGCEILDLTSPLVKGHGGTRRGGVPNRTQSDGVVRGQLGMLYLWNSLDQLPQVDIENYYLASFFFFFYNVASTHFVLPSLSIGRTFRYRRRRHLKLPAGTKDTLEPSNMAKGSISRARQNVATAPKDTSEPFNMAEGQTRTFWHNRTWLKESSQKR